MKRVFSAAAFFLITFSALAQDLPNGRMTRLPGMQLPGMVTREDNGIPHVFALTFHDAIFLNGWLHAQDRLFQMDTTRRIASGTLAELLGTPALSSRWQVRNKSSRRCRPRQRDESCHWRKMECALAGWRSTVSVSTRLARLRR